MFICINIEIMQYLEEKLHEMKLISIAYVSTPTITFEGMINGGHV